MKKILIVFYLLAFSSFAMAQSGDVRIGYFNFAQVMANIPQAVKAEKRLEAEFAPRKAMIEGLAAEREAVNKAFEKDSLIMSVAEQEAKRRQLRNTQRELKLLSQEYEEDLALRHNQETIALQKLIRNAVLEVAKEGKFDLILDQSTILYASDKVDITAKVMERLAKS